MEVTVDFYIDEAGQPRLPAIRSMSDPVLGRIVLRTIAEWRFAPPTHDGKPAVTRARQQFVFRAGVAAPETAEPQRSMVEDR
jgi:TonB family protein